VFAVVVAIAGVSTRPLRFDCDDRRKASGRQSTHVRTAPRGMVGLALGPYGRILMFAPLRAWPLTGTFLALALACGGDKKPSMSEALAQSDQKAQEEKAAKEAADAKLAEAAKQAKEGVLEHPWTFDAVRASLPVGTAVAYEMSGTNAKGKPVKDRMLGEVKGASDDAVKIVQHKESQQNDKAVTQPQGSSWDKLSPFFRVEQSETKLLRRESVEVPAGTFDCVVAEVTGFFGNRLTVWMIVDKPGLYAQVVEHANTGAPTEGKDADQTEITYALASIEQKG
jgi:hypothetical protein